MKLQIIYAKVQTVFCSRRKRVVSNGVADKGKVAEKKQRCKITIGTYQEFNDGWSIEGPDGRIHTGTGTVVRFNFRHGTWSVQRPQRCETNVMGYVFTVGGEPCWLKPERESGFTTGDFERAFSPDFVKLCFEAHGLTEANAAGLKGIALAG